ncbi:MAG: hypothetical protein PWQ61_330 [Betaproteobacteria bacterium]|nr:hypothetical protein [Betaproteobacteria bacterium]
MDMSVSPALVADRVAQMRQGAVEQQVQIHVLKEAMQTQASAAATLLNAVAGDLPLASTGPTGTQVNTMV